MGQDGQGSEDGCSCLASIQKPWISQSIAAKFLWKENVYNFVFMYCSSQHFAFRFFGYVAITVVGSVPRLTSLALEWTEKKTEKRSKHDTVFP